MTSLRTWAAGLKSSAARGDAAAAAAALGGGSGASWRWLADGGRPAKAERAEGGAQYGTLYCTGHQVCALRVCLCICV